jgi:hypothetical protein
VGRPGLGSLFEHALLFILVVGFSKLFADLQSSRYTMSAQALAESLTITISSLLAIKATWLHSGTRSSMQIRS